MSAEIKDSLRAQRQLATKGVPTVLPSIQRLCRRHAICLLGLSVLAPVALQAQPVELRLYDRSPIGWTIAYPSGWQVDDSERSPVLFRSDSGPFALIGVHGGKVRFNRLDDFVDFTLNYRTDSFTSSGKSYRVLDRKRRKMPDGAQYVQVDDEIAGPNGGRSRIAFLLVEDMAFMIVAECKAAAWSALIGTFDMVIRTFTLPPA